ncbi:MAG: SCO family protein [Bacteroidia bacterium]|nr:SCO family protein [Bacteroidia bacterium]MBP8073318.1 SCO family protein [Bacteroidia bacterium]
MRKNARPLFILATILIGAGISYMIMYYVVGVPTTSPIGTSVKILPIMVPNPDGGQDSVIKTVGKFSFVSQTGNTITQDSLRGKIWVADVFFTTCTSICPKLSQGLQKIQTAFADDPEVKLVSFSVDPEYDSLSILQAYAAQYGARPHQWYMLTGNKTDLYKVEHEDFFFSATEDEDKTIKFVHDNTLRLVDKEGRFRGGFYDGTNPVEVDSVIADIKRLKNEYAQKK